MESNDKQTLVLHPDSDCTLINNLLDNINHYVLKVHEHCLASNLFPEGSARSDYSVSYKDSGEINPGECHLCTATIDGIPLKNKKSRTYGVELAEEALEYHQGNDKRSEKEVCNCSPPCTNTTKNIFVKITNNDKEIIEWFKTANAEHIPRRNTKKTKVIPVKAPFTTRVTNLSTANSNKDDIQLDISLEQIQDSRGNIEKEQHKKVSFEDDNIKNKLKRTGTRPVFTEISNILKRIANMFGCSRACQCKTQSESGSQNSADQETNSTNSEGSMTNLVVSVNSNSGEEKFVRMSSWDNNNKELPLYLMMSHSRDFDVGNANDIVEILRNKSILSSSATTYDIFSRDQSTSKRHD